VAKFEIELIHLVSLLITIFHSWITQLSRLQIHIW